jgi:predicted transcriptional regulator of viral defense system
MNLLLLNSEDFIFFTTREFALANKITIPASLERLKRLAKKKYLIKLNRGVWANPNHPFFNPFLAVPYLLGNDQGYVSFLSALSKEAIISQIPQVIQVATTGRSRLLRTPIATYEFFQLNPSCHRQGINQAITQSKQAYLIASPEKALLDLLYLSSRKGNRFESLPELDLSENFNKKTFWKLLTESVQDSKIRSAIKSKADLLFEISDSIDISFD